MRSTFTRAKQMPLDVGPLIGEMPSSSLMTVDEALELFRSRYANMPRHEACLELGISHSKLCDFLKDRRHFYRCLKVLEVMGLREVVMLERVRKDKG